MIECSRTKPLLLSIIIPCLNESEAIRDCLLQLQPLTALACELIVVDGGSSDDTVAQALPLAGQLVTTKAGRARQMNAGAEVAAGEWLLFLHADSQLPRDIAGWLASLPTASYQWGFFRLQLSGRHILFRLIEAAINVRSRATSVATGDQCLFSRRRLFNQLGGFADIPLMEDVAFSKMLRRHSRPFCWPTVVVTSSRRWEQRGILTTVLLMWRLRLAYFLGVKPERLYRHYYE